jgi:hypothetical protein
MLFGRDLRCPFDVISRFTLKNWVPRCPVNYVEWVSQTINITYEFSNQNLQKAPWRKKKNYDRSVKPRSFDAGDFVWRWYPQKADQKLGLGWTGPCLVKWKISEVLYQIQKDPDSRKLVVHVDHLKPYSGENIPGSCKVDESVLAFPNSTDLSISDEEEYVLGEIETPEGHRVEKIIKDSINVTPPILTRCDQPIKKPNKYSPTLLNK